MYALPYEIGSPSGDLTACPTSRFFEDQSVVDPKGTVARLARRRAGARAHDCVPRAEATCFRICATLISRSAVPGLIGLVKRLGASDAH